MTISGGQILHKAVYPGSFSADTDTGARHAEVSVLLSFLQELYVLRERNADTVFQKEWNKNTGISKMVQQNVLRMTPIYISS